MYRCMLWGQNGYGNDPNNIKRFKKTFQSSLKWNGPAQIFACSWSDYFIEQDESWHKEAWEIRRKIKNLAYKILKKRPRNIIDWLRNDLGGGYRNIWLGVGVRNEDVLWRVDSLIKIPAILKFISFESAFRPVDFAPFLPAIQWVISGGKSGSLRYPIMHWFRDEVCQGKFLAKYMKR